MEIVSVQLGDSITAHIEILAGLLVERSKDLYRQLPTPTRQHYEKVLTASPRPTHRMEYYLIKTGDNFVGYLQLRYNLITDKHQLSIDYFLLPVDQQSDLIERGIAQLLPDLPESITSIDLVSIKDIKNGKEWKFLHFFNQISDRLVYTERVAVALFDTYELGTIKNKSSQLLENATDNGYELVFVENGEFEQRTRIDYTDFVRVVEEIQNAMPNEDADWEDEVVTIDVQNALYQNIAELGGGHWSLIAIHSETNEIVGYTDIFFYRNWPRLIYQGDTGVVHKHRGNRLGKTLKYTMLTRLLTQFDLFQPTHWVTGNAQSNVHMIKINEELDYQHWYSNYYYNVNLETLNYLLGN